MDKITDINKNKPIDPEEVVGKMIGTPAVYDCDQVYMEEIHLKMEEVAKLLKKT